MNGVEHLQRLNSNSFISIGLAIMMILATLWIKDGQSKSAQAAIDVASELNHYKDTQKQSDEAIRTKIDDLSNLIKNFSSSTFDMKDHKIFVLELRQMNPGLKVPDAEPIGK